MADRARNVGEVEVNIKLDLDKRSVAAAEASVRTFGQRVGKSGAFEFGKSFSKFLFPEIAVGMQRGQKIIKAAATTFIVGALANTLISGTKKVVHGVGAVLALIPAALAGVGLSIVALKEGFEDLSAFMSRRFAKAWKNVQREMGRAFMRPLINEITRATRIYLPMLGEALEAVAGSWGKAFGDIAGWLLFDRQVFRVQASLNSLKLAIDDVAGAVPFIFAGLFPLLTVGSDLLAVFASRFKDLSMEFYRFMQRSEDSGRLHAWILEGIRGLQQLWETFKQVVRIAADLGAGLENIFAITQFHAGGLLDVVELLAQKFRDWTESAEGQQAIADIWQKLKDYVNEVYSGVKRLWEEGFRPLLESEEFRSFFSAWEDFRKRVWERFIDTLIVLLRDVAPPFLQFLGGVIRTLSSIDSATGGAVSSLGGIALALAAISRVPGMGSIGGMFKGLSQALGWVLKPLGQFLSRFGWVQRLVAALRSPLGLLVRAFTSLGGIIVRFIGAALAPLAAALGLPVWAVALIIAALVAAGVAIWYFRDQIWRALQAVGRFFVSVWDRIYSGFVGPIVRFFTGPFVRFWQRVWGVMDGPVRIFMRVLQVIFNILIVTVFGRLIIAVGILVAVFRAAWPAISAVFRFILRAAMGLINWIRSNWQNIVTFIAGPVGIVARLIITHWNTIRNFFVAAWNAIRGAFSAAWNWIRDSVIRPMIQYWHQQVVPRWQAVASFFASAWGAIRRAFSAAWHWIRDSVLRPAMLFWQQQIIPRWQAVTNFFSRAWGAIRRAFSSAWNWIRDNVVRPFMLYWDQRVMPHFRRVRDFFSRIWDQIRRTASSVWERIVSAVRGPVNAIIGAINALIRGINSVINLINRIPGVDIPRIPEIPRLGGGGGGGTARTSGGSRGQGPGARAARMAQGGQVPLIDPSQRGPFKTHGIRAIVGEGDPRHPEYVIPTDPRYRPRAVALFASLASDLGLGPRMGRRPEFSVPDVGPVPGYFLGGIIDSAKSAIGGVLRRVGGWVQGFTRRAIRAAIGPVNNRVKGLLNRIPNAFRLRDIAHGIRKTIVRVLVEGVGGAAPEDDPAAPSGPGRHGNYRGGGGVERWRSLALRALEYTGYPTSWIGSLLRRMNQESGGNPFAINRWDINARRGTPSMGLMQTIGPTFYSYARELAHRGPFDPFANIVAAIRYTVARYGSGPAGWDRPGGYARGGIITGFGPKIITAHGREMMLNLRQQANLFRLLDGAYRADRVFPEEPGGSKGGETTIINNINLTFNVYGATSKEEADRQLRPYLELLEERRVLNAARLP